MNFKTITYVIGALCFTCFLSCGGRNSAEISKSSQVDIAEEVARRLEKIPAWAYGPPADAKRYDSIIAAAKMSAEYSIGDTRNGIILFLNKFRSKERGLNVEDMSRLFIFTRVYFDVPQKSDAELLVFGGWRGAPRNSLLWPLGSRSGDLVIADDFRGYMGDDYEALAEFDYFAKRFPRRGAGENRDNL